MTKNTKNLKEDAGLAASHSPDPGNSSSLFNPEVQAKLDQEFAYLAGQTQVTVNIALTKIRKILAQYNIFFDTDFLRMPEEDGEYFFELYQHGKDGKIWDASVGNFVSTENTERMFLYIDVQLSPTGYFVVDAEVLTREELDDVIGDDDIDSF